ncbi:SH3 domain-containing protein [Flavobacteriaceae bacterium W22]|nr:SH3 domain-containing protein [Flavobacteriaceae bacterium W22]
MKKLFTLFVILLSIYNYSQVAVKGYYRKNGTYVQPHVRTPPNSTITDNYSYKGNYNPNTEYTTSSSRTSSPTTSNYYNNSSSSNYDKEWVNGYYRTDGIYVNGYYRKKKSTTSNSPNSTNAYYAKSNSSSTNYPTKKYVNTTNVNLRSSPEVSDNIVEELAFSDEVKFLEKVGYWDKVQVRRYVPSTNSYSTIDGFINSRYLTTSSSNESTYNNIKGSESKYFKVKVDKTYFHNTPNIKDVRKAYLIYDTEIYAIAESKYFIYIEFINSSGQTSIGWILKDDLIRE